MESNSGIASPNTKCTTNFFGACSRPCRCCPCRGRDARGLEEREERRAHAAADEELRRVQRELRGQGREVLAQDLGGE